MKRKLVLTLSAAALLGAAIGCKDDRPTPMQFDPAKANYTGQQQKYTKGTSNTTGDAATTPE
jgi:hypothetical protein